MPRLAHDYRLQPGLCSEGYMMPAVKCAGVLLLLLSGCTTPVRAPASSIAVASQLTEPPIPIYHLKWVTDLPADLSANIDQAPWPDIPAFPPMTLVGTHGQPCPFETRVKACWTDRAVRIIWRCQYDQVRARQHGTRDVPLWNDDVVEVFLSPDSDLTRYREIVFNPYESLFDAAISNPTIKRDSRYFRFDPSWNCQGIRWKVIGPGRYNAAGRQDRWWTVEAEIPFAGLGRPTPSAGEAWRAGLFRVENAVPVQWHSWSVLFERKYGFHQSDRLGLWIFDK